MRKPKEKWMKHLNRGLIDNVLELDDPTVDFKIKEPEYVLCTITTADNHLAHGLSICSIADKHKFSYRAGKSKAVSRALKALKNKGNSGWIRKSEFPTSWSNSQMKRVWVLGHSHTYKSKYD